MLYITGVIDRLGKTNDGNTVGDYDSEEIKRKITISASMMHCEHREQRLILLILRVISISTVKYIRQQE